VVGERVLDGCDVPVAAQLDVDRRVGVRGGGAALADHAKYTEGFKAVGLNVNLVAEPAPPSEVGKMMSVSVSGPLAANGGSIESEMAPEGCLIGQEGCAITVKVPRDWTGWAAVRVGRRAEPGENYQSFRPATAKGEMLDGFKADEKSVGEVLAEIHKRGLKAVFQVVMPNQDGNGYSLETSSEVGDDWIVWDVQSHTAGVVRLMVTKERLPKNPIYGGPKPADKDE
jgi:hypothetical protein